MFRRGEHNFFLVAFAVIALAVIVIIKEEKVQFFSEGLQEVMLTLCASYAGGVLIFSLTTMYPNWLRKRDFRSEYLKFLEESANRIQRAFKEIIDVQPAWGTEEENDKFKKDMRRICQDIKYDYKRCPNADSILTLLRKIKDDSIDLKTRLHTHSSELFGSNLWREVDDLINHKLLKERNCKYLRLIDEDILNESVEIGWTIADFYLEVLKRGESISKMEFRKK